MLLAVVVLATAAGCDADHDGASTAKHPSAITSTTASTGGLPLPEAPPAVTVRAVARFDLPNASIGPLSLEGHRVVFPLAEDGGRDWGSVGVVDLATHSQDVVAHSQFDQGLINWAAGTGTWVAWTDQSRRQSDSDPNVLWRIRARNLTTGAQRILATNGQHAHPFVPEVHAKDGYLFWTQAETDRTALERTWRPGWARPRAVLRHTEMTPGSETAANGRLVFLGRAATGAKGPHGRR